MSRPELIEAVQRVMDSNGSEDELDELIDQLSTALPHPDWTDLIFHDPRELTAEQVVDEALAYRGTPLGGGER